MLLRPAAFSLTITSMMRLKPQAQPIWALTPVLVPYSVVNRPDRLDSLRSDVVTSGGLLADDHVDDAAEAPGPTDLGADARAGAIQRGEQTGPARFAPI